MKNGEISSINDKSDMHAFFNKKICTKVGFTKNMAKSGTKEDG